jgi:hypothetical protein
MNIPGDLTKGWQTLSVWFVLTALLGSSALFAGETDAIPQRFHVRIGGFMGHTYEVQLQDGCLKYETFGRGHQAEPAVVRPTLEQWKEFRRELDAIGVWRWQAQYEKPGVVDGTQWSLEVSYPDQAVKTQGSNNYPGDTPDSLGVPSGGKAFTRYLKAIQRLLGGKAFE